MISKFFKIVFKHKTILLLVFFLTGVVGFFIYTGIFNKNNFPQYLITEAKRGNLEVSVSGSGQVSNLNELEIKSKVSGEVVDVYPFLGKEVEAGSLLAVIDYRDAQRAVRDAEISLEIAKLELEKMLQPPDRLTLLQAENAVVQAKEQQESLKKDIQKAYEDGFNVVSNVFLELPDIMAGLESVIFDYDFDRIVNNLSWYLNQISDQKERNKALEYQKDVINYYNQARLVYSQNIDLYKSTSRNSSQESISKLILETYETVKLISEAVKNTSNYIDFVRNFMELRGIVIPSQVASHQSSIENYITKTNSYLSSLLSAKQVIENLNHSLLDIQRTIQERELSLEKIKKGPDAIDIQAKKISIQQKENALQNAKELLADHYIRAPFGGIVAKINIKKGDNVLSGSSLFVLATKNKIAEISLNEIDAAKVKVGQKALLFFDALPDLMIEGKIVEVSVVGDISQGVVTYTAKIEFNTQDERIKPAMSVSAKIIIEEKNNILLVPNYAIKTQGEKNYVEVVENIDKSKLEFKENSPITLKIPPRRQFIEIGSSNDEFTEVLSGLNEGDLVVLRTIQLQSNNQTNSRSLSPFPGVSSGIRPGVRNVIR
ncbi:MAG: hypothetical protein KatS3mg098_542 [Candidatus Parcubacteria bacterium]|nr:MAG: hypothetical protein KatS3mg098_542 [Candidatus Parcubacteria bacterium]